MDLHLIGWVVVGVLAFISMLAYSDVNLVNVALVIAAIAELAEEFGWSIR